MNALDLMVLVTALFIMGMIWLRTRMQYRIAPGRASLRRRPLGQAISDTAVSADHEVGPLKLQPAGRMYFAASAMVIAAGWYAAPAAARILWTGASVTPTLTRVIWSLATYYLFILVHRVVRIRGLSIFKHQSDADAALPSPPNVR